MRSEPERDRPGQRRAAPAAVTASTMRESSAATSTGRHRLDRRRQTWTIIGSPRCRRAACRAARRAHAGRYENDRVGHGGFDNAPKNWLRRALIRVAKTDAKRLIRIRLGASAPAAIFDSGALFANGNNQRQQDCARGFRRPAGTMALGVFSSAVFAPEKAAKPGYALAGGEATAAPAAAAPAAPEVPCRRCSPRPTRPRARPTSRFARPATTSTRAAAPRSARRCGASSGGRSPPSPASRIPTRSRRSAATGLTRSSTSGSPSPRRWRGTKMAFLAKPKRPSAPTFSPSCRSSRTIRFRSE